ncbi:MAG: hypothetical protein PHU14_05750 [Methylovulum sp.]|nr:hypothetical protein [Methylovulum sp.]
MSTIFTNPAGTRTALTTTALNALASATYVNVGSIDLHTGPTDCIIEVEATPTTVSSLFQLSVFAKISLDGSNYSTGPESGTATSDELNLKLLGVLPLNSSNTQQRGAFSVMTALGFVPPFMKIIVKNETGAALAASGHAVYYTTYTGLGA